jgi:hypothetical protein
MQVARPGTLPKSAPGSGSVLGNPIGKANTRSKEIQLSSPGAFLAQAGLRTKTVALREKQIAFSQGDAAGSSLLCPERQHQAQRDLLGRQGSDHCPARRGGFLGGGKSVWPIPVHDAQQPQRLLHRQSYSGLKEKRWYGRFMSKIHSATFSSIICWPGTVTSWKT